MKKNLVGLVLSWRLSPFAVISEGFKYLGMGILWAIIGVCIAGLVTTRFLKDIVFFAIEKIFIFFGNSFLSSQAIYAAAFMYAIAYGSVQFNNWLKKVA